MAPALHPLHKKDYSCVAWVDRFPGCADTADLRSPFKDSAEAFIEALRLAGATVVIAATFRPPRRAYLMHWAWKIAKGKADPQTVPKMENVNIRWAHADEKGTYSKEASIAAAKEMVAAFDMTNLGTAPALQSRHTRGFAIDMTIRWTGTLSIVDAGGNSIDIETLPRSGLNAILQRVGEGYGVIKYKFAGRDDPHWSDTGA
jgi:D-alanyl-D-alanine dipeptidase